MLTAPHPRAAGKRLSWHPMAACLLPALLAACGAALFDTPEELRGVWKLHGHGQYLQVSARSIAVYSDTAAGCRLTYTQDFAGPRLTQWEVFPEPDGTSLLFREPPSRELVRALRRPVLPERCITGQSGEPWTTRKE